MWPEKNSQYSEKGFETSKYCRRAASLLEGRVPLNEEKTELNAERLFDRNGGHQVGGGGRRSGAETIPMLYHGVKMMFGGLKLNYLSAFDVQNVDMLNHCRKKTHDNKKLFRKQMLKKRRSCISKHYV